MDELKEIAPKLSKIKKEIPFGVPENYFDDFSARLQMKIGAERITLPNQQNRIIQFLKPALGLAASFALIFMLVYWPLNSFTPTEVANSTNSGNEITDSEYRSMVEGMDENSFYTLLEEPAQTVQISDDDLLNYLSASVSDYDIYMGTEN
ncbi:MAG TPA: hypothetical protein VKA38_05550 [Draconibacterium sp.]|nr:hypothetical protein [Draconibacterium sp.]